MDSPALLPGLTGPSRPAPSGIRSGVICAGGGHINKDAKDY